MKKVIKNDASVSVVVGVILMVAITVAIAGTIFIYVSGMMTNTPLEDETFIYKVGILQGFYKNESGTMLIVFNNEHLNIHNFYEGTIVHFIGQNVTLVLQNYTNIWYDSDYTYRGIYLNLDE